MAVPEIVPDPTPNNAAASASDEPRDAVPQPIRAHGPSASPSTPSSSSTPDESAGGVREQKPGRALVIALVILLSMTFLSLLSELRTTAALQEQVSALEAEVAKAQATVSSYQTRFELVRDEVGELVTRIGALNSLIAPPVLPAGDSDDLSNDSIPGSAGDPAGAAPVGE